MIGKYFKVNSNLVLLLLITAFTPLAYKKPIDNYYAVVKHYFNIIR